MAMDLEQLRSLVMAVEEGTLSGAARRRNLTQPAVSLQIKALEEDLGERLFHRAGRGVRLTRAGETVLRHAREILRSVETARAQVSEIRGLTRGTLEVGVTDAAATGVLPRAYALFHRRHPGIEVRVEVHPTGTLTAMVREGALGVGVGTLPAPDGEAELEIIPLEREFLGLVIPADRRGEPLARLVRDLPFIGYPAGSTTRRIIDEALARGDLAVAPRMEIGRPDVMIRLVEAGVGMAVLPESISQASAAAGLVHRVPRRRLRVERWLGLFQPREDRSEPAARAFAGVLCEVAGVARPAVPGGTKTGSR